MRVKSVAERGPTRKCVDVPIAVRLENYLLSYRIISSEFLPIEINLVILFTC